MPKDVLKVPVDTDAILIDIDTEEAYQKALQRIKFDFNNNCRVSLCILLSYDKNLKSEFMKNSQAEVSRGMVQVIAGMSSFLTPFTSASVNIALPSIGKDLNLGAVSLGWVATAYLLAAAVLLVPIGRIADISGRKKIFLIGMTIDAVASIIAGFAQSGAWLIAFRALQGVGGAMIFGTGISILTSVFPAKERGRVLGINVATVYLGLSVGPLIGGLLTEYVGWRSIFYLNALIGIITICFVFINLKGEWAGARGESLDLTGALIYFAGVIMLMLGLTMIPSPVGIILSIIGAAALLLFVFLENRRADPILDIGLFRRNIVFRYSNLAALINYAATFAVGFVLSLYLQYIDGFSPEKAGLILIIQPVIQVICSPIAGNLSDRVEPVYLASLGMGLTTVGLVLLIFLGNNTPLYYILVSLAVLGLGFGFFSSPNTNAIMSSVDKKIYGVASGTLGTMRVSGQMFSLVLCTMLFNIIIGGTQIIHANYPQFLHSVHIIFIISAALCFIGIFASIARGKRNPQATS